MTQAGAHADLLERMRVLPERGGISESEWEVCHLYLALAFRKRAADGEGASGAGAAPSALPMVDNPGNSRLSERDIVILGGGAVEAGEHAAFAAAPSRGDAEVAAKRAAPDDGGGGAGRGGKRAKVTYEQDTLFD